MFGNGLSQDVNVSLLRTYFDNRLYLWRINRVYLDCINQTFCEYVKWLSFFFRRTFVKSDFYFVWRDRNYIIMYRSQQWQFEIFSRSYGNSVIANASNAITWIKCEENAVPEIILIESLVSKKHLLKFQ